MGAVLGGVLFWASVAGCVWRTETAEHYFGPVLFRYTTPATGHAHVAQQRHLLFLIEGGQQWGISVGLKDRVLALPEEMRDRPGKGEGSPQWKWSMVPDWAGGLAENDWHVSLFYLRGERPARPEFVSVTTYGFSAGAGSESNAVTIGVSSLREFRPRSDALYLLEYFGDHPMRTRFKVAERTDSKVPAEFMKEVNR